MWSSVSTYYKTPKVPKQRQGIINMLFYDFTGDSTLDGAWVKGNFRSLGCLDSVTNKKGLRFVRIQLHGHSAVIPWILWVSGSRLTADTYICIEPTTASVYFKLSLDYL